MTLHVEPLPNSKVYQAFMYGPVVLAGDLGTSGMEGANRYQPNVPAANLVPPAAHVEIPVFVSADLKQDLTKIKPVAGKPLTFTAPAGLGQPGAVTLVPFYTLFEPRYTIYWKVYSPTEWAAMTKSANDAAARRKVIESRTIDAVDLASDASESAHAFSSQSLGRGRGGNNAPPTPGPAQPTQLDGRRGREARGGFISYTLKVAPEPTSLVVTYRIENAGAPRTFDVLVDGTKIASESMTTPTAQFFDKEYELPATLTRGKSQVTVRFETPAPAAAPDAAAAGAGRGGRGGAAIPSTATIFDVRTVKR